MWTDPFKYICKGVSANIDFYSDFVYSMVLYISLLMDIDKI